MVFGRQAMLGVILMSGCATLSGEAADAGAREPTEAERAALKMASIQQSLDQAERERGQRLWVHWFDGGAVAFSAEDAGHRSELLALTRQALSLGVDAGRLEHRLVAESVTALTREAESEAANVAATASFFYDGKEIALRDVGRLLANEPSALRRKALFAASEEAARREAAALERRDTARAAAFDSLDAGLEATWGAQEFGLSVEEAANLAAAILDETESLLPAAVERLARAQLNLAPAVLHRSDVPRLLKPPTPVDALFPKGLVVERARTVLSGLGAAKRVVVVDSPHPLPLTLLGQPTQIAYRAQGGFADQHQLLTEVGAGVAGPSGSAAFRALLSDRSWLATLGLSESDAASVAEWAETVALVTLRRAAAVVAFRFDVRPTLPEDKAQRWAALATRAVRVPHSDGSRWPSETSGFARALQLLVDSRSLPRLSLPPNWWARADTLQILLRQP
jgi:hypothetical protein